MARILPGLLSLSLCTPALGMDGQWPTFKTNHNSQGLIEHQIDTRSVRQEGPYRIFWSRMWVTRDRQPLVFSRNEHLYFWSRKFAVDCVNRRFASQFIDSNNPDDIKHKADLRTMRWDSMENLPVVGRVVCGYK